MIGRYTMHTSFTTRDLDHPKVREIIDEIRERFGHDAVRACSSLVVVKYDGTLDITSVARLDNLVSRLGDYALSGALVTTSFCGVPNAIRVIGPSPKEIATTRHMLSAKIMSFESRRVTRTMQNQPDPAA